MAKKIKVKENWKLLPGVPPTEMDLRILEFQSRGKLCPSRELIKTREQIEGIRRAGALNTAVLDEVAERIREGMSTEDINRIVHDFTLKHGGIPAPLNYEGFPKSCCTSVNEVVCHGIPSEDVILEEGDIINVDCTTILNGYYADASRMFVIGHTSAQKQRLVDAKLNGAHYFEDEDLDKYKGIEASQYSDTDIEEFRYVMYTMQPEEVMEWLESLNAREIELPNELKEEAFAIINESK